MEIRLIGSHDLVNRWQKALEREYSIRGRCYPSRRNPDDVRVYFSIDDRNAEKIINSLETRLLTNEAIL